MPADVDFESMLPVVNEQGEPLRKTSRMKDAKHAWALYRQFYQSDMGNRLNRMRLQLILDGFPPHDPAKQKAMGVAGEANVNVGLLKTYLTEASRPLVDQINGVEALVNVVAKQEGDEDLNAYCQIVQEEHFNLVTKDDSFDYHFRTQELVRQFVTHGVTVPYFPDEWDWRWDSEPLGNFLIKHNTKASESYVQVAFLERTLDPSYLSDKYDNGNDHWNKAEILRVLRDAAPERTVHDTNYEDWEVARKENDFYLDTIIPQIEGVNCWVKEMDGKVSFFIFDKKNPKDFLYKKEFLFDSNSQAFQFMTYGVGTTGTYHGIRGLAYDAVPLVLELNRLISSFIDGLRRSGKMYLQPSDADSLQNIVLIEKAGYTIVPPGFTEMTAPVPNFAQGLIPGIGVLQGFLNQGVSAYAVESGEGAFGGDARKTKAEIMARLSQIAAASGGNAELFSKSWSRLVLEQFRRMIRKDYREEESGGAQIKEFRKRCEDKGVPKDFWNKIDLPRCSAVPAVGSGSASQQMMITERLLEFSDRGFFDAQGQLNVQRDAVRVTTGSNEAVKTYCGTGDIGRPLQDHRNASFENSLMNRGESQPVWPNDNHQVHAEMHLGASGAQQSTGSIADLIQALQEATAQNDEDSILRLAPIMQLMIEHTAQHVEAMKNAPLAAQYREQLQEVIGVMVNIERSAQRIMRERRKQEEQMMQEQAQAQMDAMIQEAAGQSEQRDVGQDFWQNRNLARTEMKLEENDLKFQQTFRHDEEKHLQDLAIKDQKAAQDLLLKQAKVASDQVTKVA